MSDPTTTWLCQWWATIEDGEGVRFPLFGETLVAAPTPQAARNIFDDLTDADLFRSPFDGFGSAASMDCQGSRWFTVSLQTRTLEPFDHHAWVQEFDGWNFDRCELIDLKAMK